MAIDAAYGVTLPPRQNLRGEAAELAGELAEIEQIELSRLRNAEKHRDKIGEVFGGKICKLNHSFWFVLNWHGQPITVNRYYQDKNVAVDIFQLIRPSDRAEIEDKRRALAAEGIKYAAIDYTDTELASLLKQIMGKVKLWPFGR